MNLDLEKEFEEVKNRHMIKTCFCYAIMEVEKEVEEKVNLPIFLMRDTIASEAKNRVLGEYNMGEDAFKQYYDKAYFALSEMS